MKPAIVLLVATLWIIPNTMAAEGPRAVIGLHPATEGITGDTLFSELIEHNRSRESLLHDYSVTRKYVVKNDEDKPRAESEAILSYRAPDRKEFRFISGKGSGYVRNHVFKALLDSEVEAAAGTNHRDSSITPANYSFELLGEDDIDGYHAFVVNAIPKRKDKYLFEGKVWIEAAEFAVVRIEGQPAKSPSFWIKKVNFVRRYQRIDGFWLPLKDETVTQVRLFGTNIFTIDHRHYEINQALRSETAQQTRPR